MSRMRRLLGPLILATLAVYQPAYGQDTLEVRQGRAFAQRTCVTCHGVVTGAPSPVAGAPSFQTIAATPGMSELALRVALETPHHSMPNLMLSADEKQDVIAYIMSLRPRN
jgi:mono/diheme cytochrome c family protein